MVLHSYTLTLLDSVFYPSQKRRKRFPGIPLTRSYRGATLTAPIDFICVVFLKLLPGRG